jgi:hypothetical protein
MRPKQPQPFVTGVQQRRKIDRLVSLISTDNVHSERVAERLDAVPTKTITPADSKRTAVVWRHPPIV